MIGSRWIARSAIGRGLLRSLAVLAIGAQVSALAAPLLDVPSGGHELSAVMAPSGGTSLHKTTLPTHHHNPFTCPACIAQSIVAVRPAPPTIAIATSHAGPLEPPADLVSFRAGVTRTVLARGPPTIS